MVERYSNSSASVARRENPRPQAFKKGMPRPPNAGRKPGTINKRTRLIKDAITGAGEKLGMLEPIYRYREERQKVGSGRNARVKVVRVRTDEVIGWKPTGKGGTEGYLIWLGCNHPQAYAALMARVLPLQINAKVSTPETISSKFSSVNIKAMTLAEKMSAMSEMLSMTQPLSDAPALPAPDDSNIVDGEFTEVEDASYREAAE
jgi:hypothetical protein